VFALVLAGALATHHPTRLAVPREAAVAALRADPGWRQHLAHANVTRIQVMPLDPHYDELIVYDGLRMIYQADVSVRGTVVAATDLRGSKPAFGSEIANDPWVLGLLSVVFVLATAVWPLWRLRNLDVLVAVSLVSSVVLVNDMLPLPLVATVYPALVYLAVRCATVALGPRSASAPSTPLFDCLTTGWTFVRRRRLLRLVAVASGLIVAMVGLSSLHVVDVGYAVMEGATELVRGLLPYGHIPDVLHGDTYPLASYLLYVPFAALDPVHNVWDNADLTLVVAVVAALLVAAGIARGGARGIDASAPAPTQRRELTALRSAIAWLSFPTVLLTVSTGTTDLMLAFVLLGAILVWRRPTVCAAVLAGGAWFKLAPVALLPFTLVRVRGRALVRAVLAVLAVSAPMVTLLFVLGGLRGPLRMLDAMTFQQSRTSPHNLWTMIGSVPLQQVVEALTVALIAGAVVRLYRERALASDRTRMAALCSAVLLGMQISANYWSSFYLSWVLPLIVMSLFTNEAAQPTT
jgi:hypothetical protein